MRILINALGATKGGAMRHITNFIPKLGKHDSRNEYTFLVREGLAVTPPSANVRLQRFRDSEAGAFISRLRHDLFSLPRRLKSGGYDATVSLTNFGPVWCSVPHILFQRNPIYYFPPYLKRVSVYDRTDVLLRRTLANESMKRSAKIVTPSKAMGNMIRSVYPKLSGRIFQTLYHGFDVGSASEPLNAECEGLLRKGPLRLFYPSHSAPHKGFDVLFDALAILRSKKLDFVLYTTATHADWPSEMTNYRLQIERLGLRDCVVFLGYVPQKQMGALYRRMDLMVYPSLTESFGFSMLEGMGGGLPIVAAETEINREICESAALYYPPMDAHAFAETIQKALEPSAKRDLALAAADRLTAVDWSWDRYAREFVDLVAAV